MNKGYIKIWRRSTENPIYFSEPFTKWQAWIDLLLLANHKDRYISVRSIPVLVKRGQALAGENFLADRWQWSRGKVRRHLSFLEKTVQQIVQHKDNVTTLITVINYDAYQGSDTANGTASDTTSSTATGQQTDIPKNVKNEEGKKEPPIIPQGDVVDYRKWSEADFKKKVWAVDGYADEEKKEFFGYWTEKTPAGKMRFAKEKTWETGRRLGNAKRMGVLEDKNKPKAQCSQAEKIGNKTYKEDFS